MTTPESSSPWRDSLVLKTRLTRGGGSPHIKYDRPVGGGASGGGGYIISKKCTQPGLLRAPHCTKDEIHLVIMITILCLFVLT